MFNKVTARGNSRSRIINHLDLRLTLNYLENGSKSVQSGFQRQIQCQLPDSEIRKDIFILEPKYAMTPADYISKQEKDRRSVLSSIHAIILEEDPTVSAEIGIMMGKEMILYKEREVFKYGLAAVKNYMSLHVMPIYMDSPLHGKYRKLLPDMEFQKGCINFTAASQDSLETIHLLFADCAKVSIAEMLENRKRRK